MELDTVCYALDRYFARYLPMKACARCAGELDTREVDHSVLGHAFRNGAIFPQVETILARCTACDWWAVREFRDDLEYAFMFEDDVVMPRTADDSVVARSRVDASVLRPSPAEASASSETWA